MGFRNLTKTGTNGCSKNGRELLREALLEVLDEPGGQNESILPISQEIILPAAKPRKKKEIILVIEEEIECLNFRITTESLTNAESLLHLLF